MATNWFIIGFLSYPLQQCPFPTTKVPSFPPFPLPAYGIHDFTFSFLFLFIHWFALMLMKGYLLYPFIPFQHPIFVQSGKFQMFLSLSLSLSLFLSLSIQISLLHYLWQTFYQWLVLLTLFSIGSGYYCHILLVFLPYISQISEIIYPGPWDSVIRGLRGAVPEKKWARKKETKQDVVKV